MNLLNIKEVLNTCKTNDEMLYILFPEYKPVKIVFEDLPCPILWQLGEEFRCKHAKSKTDDMNWTLYCSAEQCEYITIENT